MYRLRSKPWVTSSRSSTLHQPLLPDTYGSTANQLTFQKFLSLFHNKNFVLHYRFRICLQYNIHRERAQERACKNKWISNHGDSWSHIQDRLPTLYVILFYSTDELRLHWFQHQSYDRSQFLQDQAFRARPTMLIKYWRKWELKM